MTDRSGVPSILFVLGKAPQASSLFPAVFAGLESLGVRHRTHLPHEDDSADGSVATVVASSKVDLVVHRGLHDAALDQVDEVARSGIDCVNPAGAVRAVSHHELLAALLSDAGLPVPASVPAPTWPAVLAAAGSAAGPVVVKRQFRGRGRAAEVASGTADRLPQLPPFEGPYTVETFIPNDGVDRKLYIIGDQVRGLLKPSPLETGHTIGGTPFVPDAATAALGLRAARACGLPLCGVDVLDGVEGPMVIDVNPFPGYRGVAGAQELVTDYLVVRARRASEQSAHGHR